VNTASGGDLNVVHASALCRVTDDGRARRGLDQNRADVIEDGAIAIRDGVIRAVGATAEVLAEWNEPGLPVIDATGRTVTPGLVECHSHPLFAGRRADEYAERLAGASLAEIAARGGGIWRSVLATRAAADDELLRDVGRTYDRMLRGGVTTAEVKSGYGQTVETELHQLELLAASQALTPIRLVITFLGAHVVPRDIDAGAYETVADRYTALVAGEMTEAVAARSLARFQDVTVEEGYFTPAQALAMMESSQAHGLPVRVHADAWRPSQGWRTAVAGGAVSAEHLTYTDESEIDDVGATETIAVVLPVAELIYMTDRRAKARRFIDTGVPLAVSTDFCSSIRPASLLSTMAMAAPWFRITPAEALVACTLNAAHSLGVADQVGSLDVGKRGDLLVLGVDSLDELFIRVADDVLDDVVIDGRHIVTSCVDGERVAEQ
jgi:imidazolonepropionase